MRLVSLLLLLLAMDGVVVPSAPAGVELHVKLPLLAGQLIVLGLLLPRQSMPPSAQDLVDGSTLLERAFLDHTGSHLLHVQHERIERLLDVLLFVLGFLGRKLLLLLLLMSVITLLL